MANQAELIVDAQNATGESPVWVSREQALYWVDIPNRQLLRWRASDTQVTRWSGEQMLACVARREGADNVWVAGMESGLFEITPQDDGTFHSTALSDVQHSHQGMRFNDGRCDRQGRFWAGTMVMDMAAGIPAGKLYRLDGRAS